MSGDVLEVIEASAMRPFKYPRLVYKGHLYHFHKPCSRHLRWKCNRVYALKCPAVLRTSMDMLDLEHIAVDHDHNHEIDDVAITELRMKLKIHKASTFFRNNTMFKAKNCCPAIINVKEGISKNNTMFKLKNGYANINIDEDDIPEDIKNNKLAKFCASINQIFFVDPLDYDYEDGCPDGLEKIIKNKNLNDISFNFKSPKIRVTRNTRKQKQIESNNSKNDTTKNNIRCSSFNDKIKSFNQVYDEILPKEQNWIVSKKKESDGQVNESTLFPNTDKEKNTSSTNTNKKINNKTINICKKKHSLISNIILDENTLISNAHEEINTLTTSTHIPKEKIALISNINNDKTTLTSNINKDKNTLASNTYKEINTLTTNTQTREEQKKLVSSINKIKNSLVSYINKEQNTLTSNTHEDENTLTSNTHKDINTLATNTHTPKEKKSLISNIQKDKSNLISNINKDKNIVTSDAHEEINTSTTNTHTPKEKKSLISNIKKDKNIVTSDSHEEINTSTTNSHTPKEKIALISSINKDKNTLTCNTHEDENISTSKTHKDINTLTTNTHTPKEKIALISSINKDKITLTCNTHEDENTLTSNTHKDINTLTTNTHTPKEKIALISNINKDKNTLTCNTHEDENTLTSNTHKDIINTLTTNTHTPKEKIALISNINKDKITLTCNTHEDENTLTSNTHKDINTLTINTHTPKEKKSLITNIKKDKSNLISNINKDKNTITSDSHEEINTSTTNTHTPKEKIALISNINKDKNTLTSNISQKKNTSTGNISKNNSVTTREKNKKKTLTTNKQTIKRTLTTNTNIKLNIRTIDKQKTKSSLIINACRKKISSKLKIKTLKPTNQNALEIKSTSTILSPTIKTTPSILTSTIKIKPSIKSCMNEAINSEDDISINSDSDGYYDNEEPNHITNDVNLVHDDMKSIYCKENWPTILNNLSDPLRGIEVYRSMLFNKAYFLLKNQYTKTKLEILKLKGRNLQWQLKFECLEFQIKKLVESTRSDRNTRHTSIQNQNQKDTALCKNIGVRKKDTNAGIKEIVLKNNIRPENLKTSKSYQQSLNSENRNLTECDSDITTTKSKQIKTNISSTQVMVDLIKDIPPSTTASIFTRESLKSKKRNVSECDTYITRSKAKIIKTNHSSVPNFDNLDVHIPPETTISIISPELFYPKQDNLIQSDSGIDEMTKSKVIETNEHSTLVPSNVCPNIAILTQYGTEIEFSEITESNMIDYYEPSTSASIDRTVNNPPVITTSGLSLYLLNNQKTISTQYNTDIRKTKSKTMESTPAYIDLTIDSPPDMTSSSVNPNMLNGQSSSTLHNTQIECYEPSTSTSIDLTVNNQPIMMNSRLNNEKFTFSQYNKDIEITSFTSKSTDLSSNIPTFSSSSVKATTPLNSYDAFCMDGQSKVKKRTTFDLFVVGKDAQLSTLDAKRIKRIDWKSPNALLVASKQIPVVLSRQNAILPVALKRINGSPPSQYPLLNMLLTKPNNTVIKPAEINTAPFNNQMNTLLPPTNTIIELDKRNILNTPGNIQMKAPFPPTNLTVKQDKRSFILNIPVNSVINHMNSPLPPTNEIIELDERNILNTPVIPVDNRMKAPLPDVVYESTQITNKINYQETIHSNYSHNLYKAPYQMKPVPLAIPLPPSEIYDYSDEI